MTFPGREDDAGTFVLIDAPPSYEFGYEGVGRWLRISVDGKLAGLLYTDDAKILGWSPFAGDTIVHDAIPRWLLAMKAKGWPATRAYERIGVLVDCEQQTGDLANIPILTAELDA